MAQQYNTPQHNIMNAEVFSDLEPGKKIAYLKSLSDESIKDICKEHSSNGNEPGSVSQITYFALRALLGIAKADIDEGVKIVAKEKQEYVCDVVDNLAAQK